MEDPIYSLSELATSSKRSKSHLARMLREGAIDACRSGDARNAWQIRRSAALAAGIEFPDDGKVGPRRTSETNTARGIDDVIGGHVQQIIDAVEASEHERHADLIRLIADLQAGLDRLNNVQATPPLEPINWPVCVRRLVTGVRALCQRRRPPET